MWPTLGFHLIAYYQVAIANALNVKMASVPDTIFTAVPSGNLVCPQPANIVLAAGLGANLSRLRLNTPKYRSISLPSLCPINTSLTVPSPYNLVDLRDMPLAINAVDEIEVDSSNSSGSTDVEAALLWVKFGDVPYNPGTILRVRATASITCAAGTWVNGTMALDQTLPAGIYAVMGFIPIGTNLAAARLVFPTGAYRPGALALNAAGGNISPVFNKQGLGCWGQFESINLPSVDCLSTGTCTTQEFYLDLVYQSPSQLLGVS